MITVDQIKELRALCQQYEACPEPWNEDELTDLLHDTASPAVVLELLAELEDLRKWRNELLKRPELATQFVDKIVADLAIRRPCPVCEARK